MNVEQAKALFPETLRGLLSFEQQGDYIIIKTRQFLGSETFSNIIRIIRGSGGEYVSAGGESHFRIPMGSAPTQEKAQTSPVPEKAPLPAPITLHFKVTKLTVALGTTVQQGEKEWIKQSYGLEVEVNSDVKDIVEKAKAETEQLVHSWLAEPQSRQPPPIPQISQFDPEELVKHQWKGKKKHDGGYATGSVSWGWDFADQFSKETLQALEKGPLTIDKYEFSLNKGKNLVQTKKK